MSLLFHRLRVHHIFGANTDVGKTLLTTALVRASATAGKPVFYLKPVSTGPLRDADDEYVKRFTGPYRDRVDTRCLFRYGDPVSPHLAALRAKEENEAQDPPPSDNTLVKAIVNHVQQCSQRADSARMAHMYVETAGGVHSPTLSGSTQLDGYRPLLLPTILIADPKLGGISATIASYESLALRGYTVDAVLVFCEEYYRNWEYLSAYFAERGIRVGVVDAPPEKLSDDKANIVSTEQYYRSIVPESQQGAVFDVLQHLDERHAKRIGELETMPRRTLDSIWWPFVQHGNVKEEKDVTVIDSACGDEFSVFNGKRDKPQAGQSLLEPHLDGSASWWTQALGHANPALTLAAARAAGRYGHVMFPQGSHLPALKLAERMLTHGPGKGWASRVFFSDNGSTGMEVALKMALRAFAVREQGGALREKMRNLAILGLRGSYHGDTIGAMDACEEGVYTCEWHDSKGYFLDPPTVAVQDGKMVVCLPEVIAGMTIEGDAQRNEGSIQHVYDVEARLDSPLADAYRKYITATIEKILEKGEHTLAALVLEPIVMGAGGMIFVDPLFQRVLVDTVRSFKPWSSNHRTGTEWSGLPVIFDEVFVGLYRLGVESTTSLLGVCPDISVNAKILTGGLVPLSTTLTTESIFRAFYSDSKADALLHGHSYTAYPIGCEVANETLNIVTRMADGDAWKDAQALWDREDDVPRKVWSFWDPRFVDAVSKCKATGEVMTLGTVLALKVAGDAQGYQSHSAQKLLEGLRKVAKDDDISDGVTPFAINYRTLGNVAYFMLSLNTPAATVRHIENRIWRAMDSASKT